MRYTLALLFMAIVLMTTGCGSSSDGGSDNVPPPATPPAVSYPRVVPLEYYGSVPPALLPADAVRLIEDSPNHFLVTFYLGQVASFTAEPSTDWKAGTQTDAEVMNCKVQVSRAGGWITIQRSGYPSRWYTMLPSSNG